MEKKTNTAKEVQGRRKKENAETAATRDLIETSFKRFDIVKTLEAEVRKEALQALKFSIGENQWDPAVKAQRTVEGKISLTMNRIPTFLKRVVNSEHKNRPGMIVSPIGSTGDIETAKICQGMVRHTEVISDSDFIYDAAYDMAMRIGWANWRILHDYCDEESFDQEPRMEYIENPFSVYRSPICRPDGSDPLWVHIITDMSLEEYKQEHPKSSLAGINKFTGIGNAPAGWVTRDGIRVAEYYYIKLEEKTLCRMDDGRILNIEEVPAKQDKQVAETRIVLARQVKWVKHNAIEVLDEEDWPGKFIPVPELSATRLNVNGRIYKAGMVQDAEEPQRLYNYMITGAAETVALGSKAPWIVDPKAVKDFEEMWRQANRRNYSVLYARRYDQDGKDLGQPMRNAVEPPIEAMGKMIQQADYDLKSVIGIYEPGLGEQGPQESGIAILERKSQSDEGSMGYADNLARAIRENGKITLDLYPHLVTTARLQRIINPDDSVKHAVVFNSDHSDEEDADQLLKEGMARAYDIGAGQYDYVISSGPSYKTGRAEAFKALTTVISAKPDVFNIIADLWFKNADFPEAQIMADRFRKMLPPQLLDPDDKSPAAQIASLSAQLNQLQTQHNQLVAELARATDTIRTDRLAIESRERIAEMNNQTQGAIAMLKTNADAGMAALQATIATIQHRMELLHEAMSVDAEAGAAVPTPEEPGKVEPRSLPVTPGQPTPPPVQPIPEGAQQ